MSYFESTAPSYKNRHSIEIYIICVICKQLAFQSFLYIMVDKWIGDLDEVYINTLVKYAGKNING